MCVNGLVLKILKVFKLIIVMKVVMAKHLSGYLVFTCVNPDLYSDFPLLFHDCTDLKYTSLDFMCRKELLFTKKNPWLVPHCGGVLP